jgi:ribose 5-phosphate isomerase B
MPRRRAITENDVRRAAREGVNALDTGRAVVTPSARDAARDLGVSLGSERTPQQASESAPAKGALLLVVGADHGGVALKDQIAAKLRELGHTVTDVGTNSTDAVDYPDYAEKVAREVAAGRARFGIMVDGAGIGSCMAANKVPRVRAAMCHDITTALNAREHNDANLLTLGGGLLGARLALDIVQTFLGTPFGGGRHARRIAKIDALDRRG